MKEQIDQLWWVVIGSNGDGMASQQKRVHDKVHAIEEILPTLVTREACAATKKACEEEEDKGVGKRRDAIRFVKDIALFGFAGVSLAKSLGWL